MNTFSEGDLIEATKGETVIRGRVVSLDRGLIIQSGGWDVDSFERSGFTLTVIEKAAPVLPTESGVYIDEDGDIWILNTVGTWSCPSSPGDNHQPAHYSPFTRLEPVAETAKKVLDRVREENRTPPIRFLSDILNLIAKEFGVTS